MINPQELTDPRSLRLTMLISAHSLQVRMQSITQASRGETRSYRFAEGLSQLKALEKLVYEQPVLMSDFDRESIIMRTNRFTVVPTPYGADIEPYAQALLAAAFPTSTDGMDAVVCPTGMPDTAIVMGIPHDTHTFLRRTFPDMTLGHHLATLCRYFASRSSAGGNGARIYAVTSTDNELDLIIIDRNKLLAANTYSITGAMDAAYFVMAQVKALEIDPMSVELYAFGTPELRNDLLNVLRTYINQAMPLVIPSLIAPQAPTVPLELLVDPMV